jgi:hypothetical protein
MDDNDKLTEQFKSAAAEAEQQVPSFPGMDAVWNKVEARLDETASKKKPKIVLWYVKRMALAAMLVGVALIGYYRYTYINVIIPQEQSLALSPKSKIDTVVLSKQIIVAHTDSTNATKPINTPIDKKAKPELVAQNHLPQQTLDPLPNEASPVVNTIPSSNNETLALITLKGKLVDAKGAPVIGARIRAMQHKSIAFSDMQGHYEISIPIAEKGVIITAPALLTDTFWVEDAVNHYAYTRLQDKAKTIEPLQISTAQSQPSLVRNYKANRALSNMESVMDKVKSTEVAIHSPDAFMDNAPTVPFQQLPPTPLYVQQPSTQGAVKQLENKLASTSKKEDSAAAVERKPVIPLQPLQSDDGLIKVKRHHR